MVLIQKKYCNNESCLYHAKCESCTNEIIVDRTFADAIKVVLPCGYTQKFWVDITDQQAIERCLKMKEEDRRKVKPESKTKTAEEILKEKLPDFDRFGTYMKSKMEESIKDYGEQQLTSFKNELKSDHFLDQIISLTGFWQAAHIPDKRPNIRQLIKDLIDQL